MRSAAAIKGGGMVYIGGSGMTNTSRCRNRISPTVRVAVGLLRCGSCPVLGGRVVTTISRS